MVRTRIFISHANKGDAAFKPVRAVCDALTERGFEAEFDGLILKPADDWYERVNLAMAQCDGAIMLVDREADESEYVRYEAAVLGNRWHAERRLARPFVLFVAIVDPDPVVNETLGSSHLLKIFGPAPKLDRVQRWKPDPALLGQPDMAPLGAAIADAFRDIHGEPWTDDTPLALARFNLWQALDPFARRTDQALASAIGRIDDDDGGELDTLKRDVAALPARCHPVCLASWLAERAATSAEQMATVVAAIAKQVETLDADRRQRFHDNLFVLHSLWVANDNCPIGSCLKGGTGGIIALNGAAASKQTENYTVRLFPAHRMFPEKYELIGFDEDEQDAAAIADAISRRLGVLEQNGLEPLGALYQKLVTKRLANRRCVCLLPRGFATPQFAPDLQALRAKFGGILFLIPLGQDFDSADIDGGVARITPPIDPELEQTNYFYWTMAKGAIC